MLVELTAGSQLEVYVLRPCIVAGPGATALADTMPWNQFGALVSGVTRTASRISPLLRPVLPDPGIPLQLVHHDDVASAITAAVLGRGGPGAYNLAGDGQISFSEVARAVGGRGVRVPHAAVLAASRTLARLPLVPALAEWVHAGRTPMLMDTSKAKRELGWRPRYTSKETLDAMAAAL